MSQTVLYVRKTLLAMLKSETI